MSYVEMIRMRCSKSSSTRLKSVGTFWDDSTAGDIGSPARKTSLPGLSNFTYMSMPHMAKPMHEKTLEVRKESFVGDLINTVAEELTKTLVTVEESEMTAVGDGDETDDEFADDYGCSKSRDADFVERLDRSISPQQCQYIFPIVLACFVRHGKAASVAVHGLENCIEAGVFDNDFTNPAIESSTLLDIAVAACCSTAHQGVYDKFPAVKSFLKKVNSSSVVGEPLNIHR